MYRIVIIAENFDFGASLAGWTERFFAGKGLFPRIDLYESEEKFYIELREKANAGKLVREESEPVVGGRQNPKR